MWHKWVRRPAALVRHELDDRLWEEPARRPQSMLRHVCLPVGSELRGDRHAPELAVATARVEHDERPAAYRRRPRTGTGTCYRGRCDVAWQTAELQAFHESPRTLLEDLTGTARLTTIEDQVELPQPVAASRGGWPPARAAMPSSCPFCVCRSWREGAKRLVRPCGTGRRPTQVSLHRRSA